MENGRAIVLGTVSAESVPHPSTGSGQALRRSGSIWIFSQRLRAGLTCAAPTALVWSEEKGFGKRQDARIEEGFLTPQTPFGMTGLVWRRR
jgi:hypothetical protein